MLIEVAWAATRTKNTYFSSKYKKLAARRGKKRALVAIAHKILKASYFMLKFDVEYKDLGPNYIDHLHENRVTKYYTKRLERLGYEVTLKKVA